MPRKLYLDLCDYSKKVLYPLYDNDRKMPGEAYNIVISTERNGWRELSFSIPSVCQTENGEEDNLVLSYLKSDYMIRMIDDYETDWFIVSEGKISHNGFNKTVQVTAGHISQLLKVKNLGLEFNDEEGNSVGTARDLAEKILEGTGWTVGFVADFLEKRTDEVKYRTLNAPAKTGAFKLMATMCDLFEAKPVYHGDSKTVDILPINPFSTYAGRQYPDLTLADGVIELHYGRNVKNVTRALNSENIVTRLYAYGSYGDKTNGYCAIDECSHPEYTFTVTRDLLQGQKYYFSVPDLSGKDQLTFTFTASPYMKEGDTAVFSMLDPASMLYLWRNATDNDAGVAYPVVREQTVGALPFADYCQSGDPVRSEERNWFSFLMDFDYYRQNGMLTDDMIQKLAEYQRSAPESFKETLDAAGTLADSQTELSKIIGSVNLCKLDIASVSEGEGDDEGYVVLTLDKTTYPDGIQYRSDYDVNEKNVFRWYACDTANSDGDPLTSASAIYIVQETDEASGKQKEKPTYFHTYLRRMDNEEDPTRLTLWLPAENAESLSASVDHFYLMFSDPSGGYLASLESADEGVQRSDKVRTNVTERHPIIFTDQLPENIGVDSVNRYGWLWKYGYSRSSITGEISGQPGSLYFYYDAYDQQQEKRWKPVYCVADIGSTQTSDGDYWWNPDKSVLAVKQGGEWIQFKASGSNPTDNYDIAEGMVLTASGSADDEQNIASCFGSVYMQCLQRDRLWQGVSEKTTYTVQANHTLPIGNYAIDNGYSDYWVFSTTAALYEGDSLTYVYSGEDSRVSDTVVQKCSGTETTLSPVKTYPYSAVRKHVDNILTGMVMEEGSIKDNSGELISSSSSCRLAGFARVVPATRYRLYNFSNNELDVFDKIVVHFYTDQRNTGWISCARPSAGGTFTTPSNAKYIRFVVENTDLETFNLNIQDYSISAANKDTAVVISDLNYTILSDTVSSGQNIGILSMILKMRMLADRTYGEAYANIKEKQAAVRNLETIMTHEMGDLYREGYWQNDSYVDGDEQKLYDDALENLEKIAFPETTYTIDFIDLYDSNANNLDYSADESTLTVSWPDVSISSAVHLVDEEIGINTWGFIDKIQKCYDKPWATKIQVNTNLTTIQQHSFQDVMTNIANVAQTVKGKITKYDSTATTSVRYADYDDLLSNLVTLTKVTEKAGGRINEMQNAITGHDSQITQTANMISAEVTRALNEEENLAARITMTENGITTAVTRVVNEKIADLGVGYNVDIVSNDGSFITEQITSLTLNAVITHGSSGDNLVGTGEGQIHPRYLTWEKMVGTDNNNQPVWSTQFGTPATTHEEMSSITVTTTDVGDQATFRLEAQIEGNIYYAYFTAANVAKVNQMEMYLSCNHPSVQTRSSLNGGTYSPDWHSQNLVLSPTLYYNGTLVDNASSEVTFSWQRITPDGSGAVSSALGEDVVTTVGQSARGTLTVSQNTNESVITYRCAAQYKGSSIRAERSFSLVTTAYSQESCSITGTHVFLYNQDEEPTQETIELLATVNGCSVSDWQYQDQTKSGEEAWTTYPDLTAQQRTSNVLIVDESDSIFYNDIARIRVKTVSGEGEVGPSDVFTIYKIRGTQKDAYVFFSDENIRFAADLSGTVPKGTVRTTTIIAYQRDTTNDRWSKVIPVYADGTISSLNQNLPQHVSVTVGQADSNLELPVTITLEEDSKLGGASEQSGTIRIGVSQPSMETLSLAWEKTVTNNSGDAVTGMITYYTKSPTNIGPNADSYGVTTLDGHNVLSIFEGPNGNPVLGQMRLGASSTWTTEAISLDPVERYMWAYDSINYTDGTTITTDVRILSFYGEDGVSPLSYGMYTPLGEVFKQDTEYIETTVYAFIGVDSVLAVSTFDWDYYYHGEWHSAYRDASYTQQWSLAWLRQHCAGGASLRVTIHYNGQSYYAYCNLIDKTDNYQASIASSAGSSFTNGVGTSTLYCRIYQSGQEVDARGIGFTYTWTRLDSNGDPMDNQAFATGKSIVVHAGTDVPDTTTFVCYAETTDGAYSTQAQFTIDCNLNIIYSDAEPEDPVYNMLWMDTSDSNVYQLKRWDGERFVPVTIDQEELQGMRENITEYSSRLKQTEDRITGIVKSVEETRNAFNTFVRETYSTELTMTNQAIQTTVTQQIEENPTLSGIDAMNTKIASWMKFDINGLEIGKNVIENGVVNEEESRFKTRLTPRRLSFIEGDEEVAYIGDRSLYITQARVTNTLNIGSNRADSTPGWYQYEMTDSGLSISWAAEQFAKYKFGANVIYNDYDSSTQIETPIASYPGCFVFLIRETDEFWNPRTGNNAYSETMTNYADGSFYFTAITYDQPGTYYYTISQIYGGIYGDEYDPLSHNNANYTAKTVDYDSTTYRAQLTVVKDNGYQITDVQIQKKVGNDYVSVQPDEIIFTNTRG